MHRLGRGLAAILHEEPGFRRRDLAAFTGRVHLDQLSYDGGHRHALMCSPVGQSCRRIGDLPRCLAHLIGRHGHLGECAIEVRDRAIHRTL